MKKLVTLALALVMILTACAVLADGKTETETATATTSTATEENAGSTAAKESSKTVENNTGVTTDDTSWYVPEEKPPKKPATPAKDIIQEGYADQYKGKPEKLAEDYGITKDELTTPVLYESIPGQGNGETTLVVNQASLTEQDKVIAFLVFLRDGKVVRERVPAKWVDGKLNITISPELANEIKDKWYRVDLVSESKVDEYLKDQVTVNTTK